MILLSLLFAAACCFNACESFFCPDPDPGFTWEKKGYVLTVPFSPDSLAADSLYIKLYVDGNLPSPEIIYSSTLDSLRITTDVKGSYFYGGSEDTIWSPKYKYVWNLQALVLDYFYLHQLQTMKNGQTPQCEPAQQVVEVTKLKIEVPRQVRRIEIKKFY
ncbi:MAG TPA: hypothetical protein VIX80_05980 [Candidatus Kapabacteria bacterium]